MTALATSPKFVGAHGFQSIAESGPLFLFTSCLTHAVVPDVIQVEWRLDELLCKL